LFLEQINLMTTYYFYRYRKRASVCCFVPPLTRGGQEGFAAVKWALGRDLPPQTPLIPPLSGGKWANDRFHPSCDCLGSDMAHPEGRMDCHSATPELLTGAMCYAHSFVNLL
jgi:hypothetical protein